MGANETPNIIRVSATMQSQRELALDNEEIPNIIRVSATPQSQPVKRKKMSNILTNLTDAIAKMQDAFDCIEYTVRQMDGADRRQFMNPETLGPISAFLQRGNGYEPAFHGGQFHNSDDLIYAAEQYWGDHEDEDEDEDEEE